jgi:formylglycine-generating enzyme required for sulfatase activity
MANTNRYLNNAGRIFQILALSSLVIGILIFGIILSGNGGENPSGLILPGFMLLVFESSAVIQWYIGVAIKRNITWAKVLGIVVSIVWIMGLGSPLVILIGIIMENDIAMIVYWVASTLVGIVALYYLIRGWKERKILMESQTGVQSRFESPVQLIERRDTSSDGNSLGVLINHQKTVENQLQPNKDMDTPLDENVKTSNQHVLNPITNPENTHCHPTTIQHNNDNSSIKILPDAALSPMNKGVILGRMINCANCEVVIGKLEHSYTIHGHIVCSNCYQKIDVSDDKSRKGGEVLNRPIPSEKLRDHGCSTKKRRLIVGVGSSIVIFFIIIFGAKSLGRQAGQQAARYDFQQELIAQNAPTGFMGAKWLMSKSQVKSLFPDIIEFAPDDLKLDSTAFGRPAFIDFVFHDNLLDIIVISFKGEKTERMFRLTHLLVINEYGEFPEPSRTNGFILISKKSIGKISIEHNLYEISGTPIEQVMLYKTKTESFVSSQNNSSNNNNTSLGMQVPIEAGTSAKVKPLPSNPQQGTVWENSIGMKLAWIPPGTFQMGSNDGEDDEKPVHTVRITRDFYMGVHEVTQGQYQQVMGTNPSKFKGSNLPVEQVSWDDAVEFCKKLSQKEGKTYRLPTEAQWEYACRAGTTTKFSFGDSESQLGEYAWYSGNSGSKTHPVGDREPNAWGLYDMHGNVFEWCQDWHASDWYSKGPAGNPLNESYGDKKFRVLRGGSGGHNPGICRSAIRYGNAPGFRSDGGGFRLVLDF